MLQSSFEASYDPEIFEVVHIDTDNLSAAALHTYWDPDNPTFPVLVGCASLYSQYGNGYIPYNVVLDGDGVLRYSASGFNEPALHAVIQQSLSLPHPFFALQELTILDDDDGDGRPDAGETVTFEVSLRNSPIAQAATNISLTFSTNDAGLTATQTMATLASLDAGQSAVSGQVFQFTVAAGVEPHWASFQFQIQADYNGDTWSQTLGSSQRIARPDLLLVDSDGTLDDNETFAQTALNSLGLDYDVWTPGLDGYLPTAEALAYSQIIWLGGIRNPDINAAERATLGAFLDRGGLLLLSSQYASSDVANAPLILRCGAQVLATAPGTLFLAGTPAADPWFGDMSFVLTGSVAANNNVQPDNIAVQSGASLLATWQQGAYAHAASYKSNGTSNVVFCGFPVEALRLHSSRPNSVTLTTFLQRVFAYHAGNPFIPPTPVSDLSLMAGPDAHWLSWSPVVGATSYRIYESSDPADFSPTPLLETTSTGVWLEPVLGGHFYQVRSVR